MRTKGTMSFTEGKAGYFKIFIHGRSVENETGNLAVFADLPDFIVEIWRDTACRSRYRESRHSR